MGICELARMCPLEEIVISGVSRLTDRSVFALANCCSSTLKELYASGCSMITQAAINYLKVFAFCSYHVYETLGRDCSKIIIFILGNDSGVF